MASGAPDYHMDRVGHRLVACSERFVVAPQKRLAASNDPRSVAGNDVHVVFIMP
jgi:hypothetical protein